MFLKLFLEQGAFLCRNGIVITFLDKIFMENL